MIRVHLVLDGQGMKEFYAEHSYDTTGEGRIVYWELENGDTISYPTDLVLEILEKEVED